MMCSHTKAYFNSQPPSNQPQDPSVYTPAYPQPLQLTQTNPSSFQVHNYTEPQYLQTTSNQKGNLPTSQSPPQSKVPHQLPTQPQSQQTQFLYPAHQVYPQTNNPHVGQSLQQQQLQQQPQNYSPYHDSSKKKTSIDSNHSGNNSNFNPNTTNSDEYLSPRVNVQSVQSRQQHLQPIVIQSTPGYYPYKQQPILQPVPYITPNTSTANAVPMTNNSSAPIPYEVNSMNEANSGADQSNIEKIPSVTSNYGIAGMTPVNVNPYSTGPVFMNTYPIINEYGQHMQVLPQFQQTQNYKYYPKLDAGHLDYKTPSNYQLSSHSQAEYYYPQPQTQGQGQGQIQVQVQPTHFTTPYSLNTNQGTDEHFDYPNNNQYVSSVSMNAINSSNSSHHTSVDNDIINRRNTDPNLASVSNSAKASKSAMIRTKRTCSICQKVFNRPSALKTHMFIHTGEKPFVCEWPGCGKKFSVRSNMIRHSKIHKRNEKLQ